MRAALFNCVIPANFNRKMIKPAHPEREAAEGFSA
jgi:hypothetical protein